MSDGFCLTLYSSDNAIYEFSKKAVENGLDIFRVFDSLNYTGALYTSYKLPSFYIEIHLIPSQRM
jgi:pyruvate/oxaloacetate carboxyltransferase